MCAAVASLPPVPEVGRYPTHAAIKPQEGSVDIPLEVQKKKGEGEESDPSL